MITKKDEQNRQWQKWKWKSTNDVRKWTIFCYWQMLKTICSYWQMLNRTSNFDASLFDKRVYDVIEMKKMRKTFSIRDKQVKRRQSLWTWLQLLINWNETLTKRMLLISWILIRQTTKTDCEWRRRKKRRRKSSTERQRNQLTELRIAVDTVWCDCNVLTNWWIDKVFNDYYWWFDLHVVIMLMWIKRMNCEATKLTEVKYYQCQVD